MAETTTADSLAERIELLERSLARWKLAVAAGGIVLAALAGAMAVALSAHGPKRANLASADEISARRFVVVDSHGKAVAILGSLEDGAIPGLVLMPSRSLPKVPPGSKKKWAALLRRLEDGGGAFFATRSDSGIALGGRPGPQGHPEIPDFAVTLGGGSKEAHLNLTGGRDAAGKTAGISLRSVAGIAEANLTSPSGPQIDLEAVGLGVLREASLTLSDPLSQAHPFSPRQVGLELKSDGNADLKFSASNSREQLGLAVDNDGGPHLDLFDNRGRLRAVLGTVNLERTRTGATEKTAPSSLTLFDKKEKLIWQIPAQ